tara:strand:- start:5021 stop:5452 length:432 start_codon:yes stop_codon:yes gene_type:complete
MAQTTGKQSGKKKPTRTAQKGAQKKSVRRPAKPKQMPKKRALNKALTRTRAPLQDKSLDAVSVQLQRIEKQVRVLQSELTESRKAQPAESKPTERKFETRFRRLDERIDSLRTHLLDLEERLEGESGGDSLHERDLGEDLDDS